MIHDLLWQCHRLAIGSNDRVALEHALDKRYAGPWQADNEDWFCVDMADNIALKLLSAVCISDRVNFVQV